MTARIVIHAGFHKTGTSSLQAGLVAARGVLRPHAKIILKPGMADLIHATRAHSVRRDPLSLAKVSARADAFARGIGGLKGRALILSAEELAGHLPGRAGADDYGTAAEMLAELIAALSRRFPGAAPAIVLGTRAPDPWLRSAHWEHVKSASMTEDFATFTARIRPAADLEAAVCAVALALAPVPVHSLPLETTPDARAALLSLAGIPAAALPALPPVPPRNAARLELLDALLHINRTIPDRALRRDAKTARLRKVAGDR